MRNAFKDFRFEILLFQGPIFDCHSYSDLSLRMITNLFRNQLCSCLSKILSSDYPEQYPSFLPELQHHLQSTDVNVLYPVLFALKELVGVFRWKMAEKRQPLDAIIQTLFPQLLNLANTCLGNDTLQAGQMMYLICKTYYASIQVFNRFSLFSMNCLLSCKNPIMLFLGEPCL